jgi:hypothetical protein
MNIITEVRKALIGRLETIRPVNGYQTDAGGFVKTGWFNEVIKGDEIASALIVVQRAKGLEPKGGPNGLRMHPGFMVVGGIRAGLDEYEDAIEGLELDLLRCLSPIEGVPPDWLPKGATAVRVGAPEPFPPGEGLDVATVAIPVHITTFTESID